MKRIITIFFAFSSFFAYAQIITFNIQGIVKGTTRAKYAYLTTLSQQIPVSSDKLFIVIPIVDGKFEFKDVFDLEGKRDYQYATIFVDERSNISKAEAASKFKQLIWVVGREKNLRRIILEDLKIEIEDREQMNISKITANGLLTKQLDEKIEAVKGKNRELINFVKKYPDSPVSFDAVKSVSDMIDTSDRERLESYWGSPLELFSSLSERLKTSDKGKELKKRIDALNSK